MIKYDQCMNCNLVNMCQYSRDYYMNKGGNYKEMLNIDREGNCPHAPLTRRESKEEIIKCKDVVFTN